MDATSAVEFRKVSVRYGSRVALDDVNLTVEPGQILALAGTNGAGKTTLMSVAAGVQRPGSGQALVFGAPAGHNRANVGFVPQTLGIYPSLRVRDNLAFFGRLAGLRGPDLARRADAVAAAVGLAGLLGRRAGALSGGEQRRLHIAVAVIHRPRLVLMDEPSANLDIDSTAALLEVVRSLAAEGAAVCYSTNHLAEVEALAHRVAVLDGGRLVACGTPGSVLGRFAAAALETVPGRGSAPGSSPNAAGAPCPANNTMMDGMQHARD